jgi:hypothetical protein
LQNRAGVKMDYETVKLQELICEREGMIAENKQRELSGQSLEYTYDNFALLALEFAKLREE